MLSLGWHWLGTEWQDCVNRWQQEISLWTWSNKDDAVYKIHEYINTSTSLRSSINCSLHFLFLTNSTQPQHVQGNFTVKKLVMWFHFCFVVSYPVFSSSTSFKLTIHYNRKLLGPSDRIRLPGGRQCSPSRRGAAHAIRLWVPGEQCQPHHHPTGNWRRPGRRQGLLHPHRQRRTTANGHLHCWSRQRISGSGKTRKTINDNNF